MIDAYKHCISRNLPLSEELIRWFEGRARERARDSSDPLSLAIAGLDTVRSLGLRYTPNRWHRILTAEQEGGCA